MKRKLIPVATKAKLRQVMRALADAQRVQDRATMMRVSAMDELRGLYSDLVLLAPRVGDSFAVQYPDECAIIKNVQEGESVRLTIDVVRKY